ncbi:helix-turn-helix transcriptional regulator [Sulfurivirga sp.]|uniref:helix-turn-helix transcriptional regulator n=1 Tax=Sulfurivirga sp. TaxID=2614236 RepID=UPI00345C1C69
MEAKCYLSAREAAKRLGISTPGFYRFVKQGLLPAPSKLGKASRWRVDELDRAMSQLKQGGARHD